MEKSTVKKYDLEERTFQFSKKVITYVDQLPKRITMTEIGRQLMRAAGSVGANYIEANQALSKKDFLMRMQICRKEAKEARYWLALSEPLKEYQDERIQLIDESTELMKIVASIIKKTTI